MGPSGFLQDEHFLELSFDAHGATTHKFQIASVTATNSIAHSNSQSLLGGGGGSGSSASSGSGTFDGSAAGFTTLGPLTDSDHRIHVNSEAGYTLNSSLLLLHRG